VTQRYGSDVIVDLLKAFGIEYVALNPGATYRGLHDSLVNYGRNVPEIITCTHEEIAVQVAHGYAKTTGRPMAAIVHDVVGLLHAAMAIYYAHVDRMPVLVLGATGPVDRTRRRPYIDWIHSALVQGNAVRDYVKWDDQPASVADFPASFARAYRIATTEPAGPVYLCYDAGLQEDPVAQQIEVRPFATAGRPTAPQADPRAIDEAAALLAAARCPVIVAEFAGRHREVPPELAGLAEDLAAAVIGTDGSVNIANTHPLELSGDQAVLAEADVVLAVDVGDLHRALNRLDRVTNAKTPRTRSGVKVIDIGLAEYRVSKWSEDLGQFQPVALSIVGDSRLALPALRTALGERLRAGADERAARRAALAARHDAVRAKWRAEARRDWEAAPMTAARLASEVWEVIKDQDWVLTANTLEDWTRRLWDIDSPARYPGRGLGTATQIGMSLGVALAQRGSGRLAVDIQPDGDLLYDASALWTAAHHKLPLLVVMYNNRAYYNDWEHQIRVAEHRGTDVQKAYLGMEIDKPAPDFAMLARSFGWHAEGPIEDPTTVRPALLRALEAVRSGTPALVDTIVRKRALTRER
jgi:acetolactate synthase-1/2/3 large subunit